LPSAWLVSANDFMAPVISAPRLYVIHQWHGSWSTAPNLEQLDNKPASYKFVSDLHTSREVITFISRQKLRSTEAKAPAKVTKLECFRALFSNSGLTPNSEILLVLLLLLNKF
jgi:hypothetical protein